MSLKQFTMEYTSPLGPVTVSSDGEQITGLWFIGQKYYADTLEDSISRPSLPVFSQVTEWLDTYFRGENPEMQLPLSPKGSAFRRAVWDILLQIPHGELLTYGKIASKLQEAAGGKRVSAQAVGGAVGKNKLSILVPCRRAVGANGSLTGCADGIEKKIRLLAPEGAMRDTFFVPKKSAAP